MSTPRAGESEITNDPRRRILIEGRVTSQSFGKTTIVVLQDRRQRLQEMCGENRSLRLRTIEGQLWPTRFFD